LPAKSSSGAEFPLDARSRAVRIYARSGRIFANLVKMGSEDAKLLERVFSHFAKKLKMGKQDGKLLEMLL
jgi:hypothetical protein